MQNNYIVYVHVNKVNGKRYIGITGRKPEERWANGFGYNSSPIFIRAIKKYGWKNFEHEILFENLDLEEALSKETELILKWKTNDSKFGYNVLVEGDIASYTIGKLAKNRRRVKCIELNQVFESIREAAKITGANKGSISKCCRGEIFKAKGYHWEYADNKLKREFEYKRCAYLEKEGLSRAQRVKCIETGEIVSSVKVLSDRYNILSSSVSNKIQKSSQFKDGLHWEYLGCKKVIKKIDKVADFAILCVETGKLYRTIKLASELTETSKTGISSVVNYKNKTAGGYHWKRVHVSDINMNQIETGNKVYAGYLSVICIETGKIYKNAVSAAKDIKINAGAIHNACQGKLKTAKGLHWQYYNREEITEDYLKRKREDIKYKGDGRSRKVVCKETKEVVDSYKELVHRYGLTTRRTTDFIYKNKEFPDKSHWNYIGSQVINKKRKRGKNQVIMCEETGILYKNAMEVYRDTGIRAARVLKVLNGALESVEGLHWKYVDINTKEVLD